MQKPFDLEHLILDTMLWEDELATRAALSWEHKTAAIFTRSELNDLICLLRNLRRAADPDLWVKKTEAKTKIDEEWEEVINKCRERRASTGR